MHLLHLQHCAVSVQRHNDISAVLLLPAHLQAFDPTPDREPVHPRQSDQYWNDFDQRQPIWGITAIHWRLAAQCHGGPLLGVLRTGSLLQRRDLPGHVCTLTSEV